MILALVTSSVVPAAEAWSNTKVMVVPDDVGCESNGDDFQKFSDVFSKVKPSLVVSCLVQTMIRGLVIFQVTFGCWMSLSRQGLRYYT